MTALHPDMRRLSKARAVLSDKLNNTPAALVLACAVIEALSDDTAEITNARRMRDEFEPVSR